MDNVKPNQKSCIHHPNNIGIVFCKGCNGYICRNDIIEINGKKRCKVCYERRIIENAKNSEKNNSSKKGKLIHKVLISLLSLICFILFVMYLSTKAELGVLSSKNNKLQNELEDEKYGHRKNSVS